MGNQQNCSQYTPMAKQPSKLRQAELTDTQSIGQSLYEQNQEELNCFGCIKYKKMVLKKIDWEYKFIKNCEKIIDDFQWVKSLIEVVMSLELQKIRYYKEVNNLKKQKFNISKFQADTKATDKQIQAFKKNLKKSVIMSFGNSKLHENARMSTINVKKSRYQIQKKSVIQGSKSDIFMERSSSNSSQQYEKKSFIQFMEEGPNKQQVKNQISKQTTHQLQIFMKFSNILEIHLSDVSCILGKIKSQYIKLMIKKYNEAQKMSNFIGDFVDDVTQFLIILKLAVMDYYNLPSFSENSINLLVGNEENILSVCTSILFKDHQFYTLLFNTISLNFKKQEQRFIKILDYLKGSGPQRFTVKDKFCLNHRTLKAYLNQMSLQSAQNIVENIQILDQASQNYEPYKVCLDHLKQLVRSRSPINKMKSIVACSQGITRQIQIFYERNCLKKQKWMLDADQVLSIFSYMIVAARVDNLHTQLFILDHFATGLQMINMTGYYIAVLNCAVQHLQNQFGIFIDPQTVRIQAQ